MNAVVVDIAAALAELESRAAADKTALTPLAETPAMTWQLLELPPAGRWEASAAEHGEVAAMVLEGIATWQLDDVRQSLGPGHVIVAARNARLEAHNDSPARVVCVIVFARDRRAGHR